MFEPWTISRFPLVGVAFSGLKDFPGDTKGGLPLKLKTVAPPGPVGVVGIGPGDTRKNINRAK